MMDTLSAMRFARQVGFGLAPNEPIPNDPLAWAQNQMDQGPEVRFFADRQGNLMQGLPESLKLLHTQEEVAHALFLHDQARLLADAKTKTLGAAEAEEFRYAHVNYPFWRLEPWKEVLVRGAMAVNGPSPVFERFWHFWTNHFTVSPAVRAMEPRAPY
jgi:hypothetical protein